MRSLFSVTYMFLYLFFTKNLSWLKSHNPKLQITRGVVGFFGLYTLFWSFSLLPLPEATAFTFASTPFITALSYPMLREHVGLPRWLAVVVGFIGVLIVARPTGDVTLLGATVAITSAAIESVIMVWARLLKKDKPITSVFYHTGFIAIIAAFILPFQWQTPSMENVFALMMLGLVSCLGHICIVYAYSIAPAVVVAPMLYTLIIWGALFGYIFWGEMPSSSLIFGVPLIVASGLYIVHRERLRKVEHIQETELG
jgi:drug/metabolite transporter (DMT)-like permease